MINLDKNKTNAIKRIADNLNISPSKTGSYLNTLVDGLYRVGEEVTNEVYNDILNTRIDTADENTLDIFGNFLGMPRVRNKNVSFSKYREDLRIELGYHRESNGLTTLLYPKGEVIKLESYELILTEDLSYNPLSLSNFASCFVKPLYSYENNASLAEGYRLDIEVPKHLREDIKFISLIVTQPKYFNREEESVLNYRKRLLGALEGRNISGSTSIDKALKSVPGVYSYHIDRHSTPQRISVLNYKMYTDGSEDIRMESNVIPYIHRILDDVKPYNTNFEIEVAKGINIHYVIETNDSRITYEMVNEAINLLILDHKLGQQYYISKRHLEAVLSIYNIQAEFNLKIYYDFRGYRELAPIPNIASVGENEFPRILSLDIVPLQEREYV